MNEISQAEQANARIAEILGWEYLEPHPDYADAYSDGQGFQISVRDCNWYSDSNAFNRDCVPMLMELGYYNMDFVLDLPDFFKCDISGIHVGAAHGHGPTIPASAALAFIEVHNQ